MRQLTADIAVVGAGSGGLSVASGAAQLGLKVVLFERGEMGGDCLNTGCVPSKALISAAKHAHALRNGARLGIADVAPQVSWPAVQAHIRRTIETIAPIDSQERFEGLGCTVVREHARFAGPQTLESASVRVKARRIVIAAGGKAFVPPIPGLDATPHLTNESIFQIPTLPARLIVLGAGPIGVELGQAFRRLGSEVVIVEAATPLNGFDREAADLVLQSLRADGVDLRIGWKAVAASGAEGAVQLQIEKDGARETISGSHLLVAVGRKPALDGLECDRGGVAVNAKGVVTDPWLRSTTNRRVWAVGDVAGREQLTHVAGWHASAFVRSVLFKAATRADSVPIPGAVYAEPELARIGLSEEAARAAHGDKVKVVSAHFHDNDRAQAEGDTVGFSRIVVGPGAKILGATIVGAGAADLIQIVGLAMSAKLGLRALTGVVAPYPTRGEIVKRTASGFYSPVLFSPGTRRLVGILKTLP